MASAWRIYAMKERDVGVAVVCAAKGYVVFDNGVRAQIVRWLDERHRPTDDPARYSYYEFWEEELGEGIGNYDLYSMPSYEDH
jgi:hypothetical protein